MKFSIDRYTLQARFFPCVISALPLFVLAFFVSGDVELKQLAQFLGSLKFYGGITLSAVALYFYVQIIRFVSKLFEASYFTEAMGFPSTYLMTYADERYSRSYKDRYRELIKRDFDMDLLDETAEAEDTDEAKKRLNEATKQVILRLKDGHLIMKHNVWYGFVRNVIGGAVFSMAFCAVNIVSGAVILKNPRLVIISAVLVIPYAFLLVFWKPLMKQNAEAYAHQLFAEYVSENR